MRKLINDGWRFCKMPLNSTAEQARAAEWQDVDLPHDWLIWQAEDLYESADAWYLRYLSSDEADAPVCFLRFDGVYMDCDVLLNGDIICTHRYGYTAFDADLSGKIKPGMNEILVHIRHPSPNSRWYSGSGIYRDVYLVSLEKTYIVPDSLYVVTKENADGIWKVDISAEKAGTDDMTFYCRLSDQDGKTCAECTGRQESGRLTANMTVASPELWSVDHPYLYQLEYSLGNQRECCRIGFRTLGFDPDKGFSLNGKTVKLKGVCLHHDLGALGSAFHEKAARRQLRIMRDMGVNAVRTSHNPPASKLLDLCDEMGFLVVDEAFDMWERPKTTYDYARFFHEHEAEDVASWIRRDRCHPCVIMWSIGNEIYDMQADDRGRLVTQLLTEQVRLHDPLEHAKVTFGSNYMPWEGAQRCADIVKIPGYNYAEKYYQKHHEKHPDWVIYGSETASVLSSRSIYHFPMNKTIMSEADLQCSALGNSNTSWGATDLRHCIVNDLNIPFSMGQFIWSGIDYIGEPTPYHTRSCYFGQTDTAGFPKDAYYLFKSLWNPEPMIHVGVSWDWNPGQLIDIPVMTNCVEAELFINGCSLGVKKVIQSNPEMCQPVWRAAFTPGELKVLGYDADKHIVAQDIRYTPGNTARISLTSEEKKLKSDGWDLAFVTVDALDQAGHPVENARDRVCACVSGGGYLVGTDNGDSSDTEGYKSSTRNLFGGKLLLIIRSNGKNEDTVVSVSAACGSCTLVLPSEKTVRKPGLSCDQRIAESVSEISPKIRKLEIRLLDSGNLNPQHPECRFEWKMLPEHDTYLPVQWQVTNESGVETPNLKLQTSEKQGKVVAAGDGQYYLRGLCGNVEDHPQIISQIEISVTGFGNPATDPYHFVCAGLYDIQEGNIGAGNEKGISFARDGISMAGFSRVDFGRDGSDSLTMPIFALDGNPYDIEMLVGETGGPLRLFTRLHYEKPSQWNVYQSETWKLPDYLTGQKTVAFRMDRKIHLKGFVFEKTKRIDRWLTGTDADELYGDAFSRSGHDVLGIGNNVTITFRDLEFDRPVQAIEINGSTPLQINTVTIKAAGDTASLSEAADFLGSGPDIQKYSVHIPEGKFDVSLIFLPGSNFDFHGIRFIRES